MNPEERQLLERSLKLSEENNKILKSMKRSMHWSAVWGFIKIVIFVAPFVIGYFYLQTYFESAGIDTTRIQDLYKTYLSR